MTSGHYLFGNGKPRVLIPPELIDADSFQAYLTITSKELRKIHAANSSMYTDFQISSPKKQRTISAPNNRLKFLQHKVKDALEKIYKPRLSAHGFIKGRSIISNALSHTRKRHLLSLDLQDFFPSITAKRVYGLFQSIGLDDEVCKAMVGVCCLNGSLPQGAPSSPIISNMICFSLDRLLHGFAKQHRLVYTRYADDISFSTNGSPAALFRESLPPSGRIEIDAISSDLREAIEQSGFKINESKNYYASGEHRKIVTGLIVNEFPNLKREYIRNIRATLFSIEKDGYAAAQLKYRSKQKKGSSLEAHVRGEINHLGSVRGKGDPTYRTLADRFNKIFQSKVRTERTPKERLDRGIWVVEWMYTAKKIDELYSAAEKSGKTIADVQESFQGTAFFLEDVGLVTAAHCLPPTNENVEYFRIWHPSDCELTFDVKVLSSCDTRDVCILHHEVPDHLFEYLKRFRNRARAGDSARAFGFTDYQKGESVTTSAGEVSHISVRSTVRFLNLSFKVGQGMSGGPVMDQTERVIGIVPKGGPEELRDYAVVLDELLALQKASTAEQTDTHAAAFS